ncbi:MAG TPA: MFS transporter [Gammaproteobacteria bacterium]|nr:MFS transporter [Gammaproteobacteria bacterium]
MNRWLILAGYALLMVATQTLWLTYAPITTASAAAMHTSVAHIGWLSALPQLVYVLIALPTGNWLDRRFSAALATGAGLIVASALLRLAFPGAFAWQLATQLIYAAGQPLVLNAVTKLAAVYFPQRERPAAISIGTAGMFLGILVAMFSGPRLAAAGGLRAVYATQALLAVVAAAWTLLGLRTPAPGSAGAEAQVGHVSLAWLRGDRLMWLLAGLIFIGFGIFNSLSTWLQAILAHFGISAVASGDIFAALTLAGIVGSATIAPLMASRGHRRGLILLALVTGSAALCAVAWRHDTPWIGGWLAFSGFFQLAALPAILDWAEQHAGPDRQGSAVAFLLLAGNLGGLVLVLVLQPLVAHPVYALLALELAVAIAVPLALALPRHPRAAAAGSS